ncbi:unnamed protein product (macronuclear) [Paramecium tetraurelia]|uniref:Uncharacterized protein n=1 Tax=Paramecium tetraurelia TaxID=5888 RepID=A0CQW9_PARTE|nr:uncharacterized protein GSPATT00009535001 [Paramecium tetraurelia]CAK73186.1 unnamed protein product [Paramecium tetraurelia]|eukprot:XP_001440583.1 hypothetical protein (macronuclear) [Paramecium tetraurelia strain d4-2]
MPICIIKLGSGRFFSSITYIILTRQIATIYIKGFNILQYVKLLISGCFTPKDHHFVNSFISTFELNQRILILVNGQFNVLIQNVCFKLIDINLTNLCINLKKQG